METDACTLPTAERPLRLAEFDTLFRDAVREVTYVSPTHTRMRLAGPPGLEATVRDLTARESACCSFFTFTVEPSAGDVTLGVEVPAPYADVLAALTARARDALPGRRSAVREDLTRRLERAAAHGPGSAGWADEMRAIVPLTEEAARLDGGDVFRFPTEPGDPPAACDLAADGGDATARVGVWQQVLARVQRRDPLPEGGAGVALRFAPDADLAGTLARLAAAEYRCCSFGSYTLVIDETGLRLEIRMPDAAAGMLAAMVGRPGTDGER
jgi:hypothetical protein